MPTPNPLYNPEWKAIHDHHDAERSALQEKIAAAFKADEDSDDIVQLDLARSEHHKACLETFRMRHETVQGYAQWVFQNFDTGMSAGATVPTFVPDFESFTTLDQVDKTWKEFHDAATEAGHIKRSSLKTGRPNDLDIFEDGSGRKLYTHQRFFTAEDLFDGYNSGWGNNGITALLSADVRPGAIHICLMETSHRNGGPSVTNYIGEIATRLHQEINEGLKQKMPLLNDKATDDAPQGLLSRLLKTATVPAVNVTPSLYKPDQMHFYIHVPPEAGRREHFSEVTFKSSQHGKFQGPEWNRFDVIPERIQNARFQNRSIETALVPRAAP